MALDWIDLVLVALLVGAAAAQFLRHALRSFRPPACRPQSSKLLQIQDRR